MPPTRCSSPIGTPTHTLDRAISSPLKRGWGILEYSVFVDDYRITQQANAAGPETTHPVWYEDSATPEVNAWIVISPDDTVTIRIGQSELGQGVWTSNAMMVCEELQCDWTKVRPQYASANRDARERAPEWTLKVMGQGATDPKGGGEPGFGNRDRNGVNGIPDSLYRRMRTNAASSVKDGRYYLQLAGAEARERLLLAAAELWKVPVAELTAKDSIITHSKSGRTTSSEAYPSRIVLPVRSTTAASSSASNTPAFSE